MNLKSLLQIFSDNECRKVYIKELAPNDNSKNQVYVGESFEILNIFPIKNIVPVDKGKWERIRFQAKVGFYWITEEGQLSEAPEAQFILYPNYPEVRFSGFLKGSKRAPSGLMASRTQGRVLFLGVSDEGKIIGFVTGPETEISNEYLILKNIPEIGVFKEITIDKGKLELNTKKKLLTELKRIHSLGWIDSKRFDSKKQILTCRSSNCGGYTLEAELGIAPNGYSKPDYLGWEVKQFTVKNFERLNSSVITLMTPEPTHGFYGEFGLEKYIRKYGYNDKMGREARLNFGGVHKYDKIHFSTRLKLIVKGYDYLKNAIDTTEGYIGLIDEQEQIAASWSFVSLLQHWNRKHANACYVPSMKRKDEKLFSFSGQQYYFGNKIILGSTTDFSLFLRQVCEGVVYYDPGIKLELAIKDKRNQQQKPRSQFRIKSKYLSSLYKENEVIDLTKLGSI